MKNPFVTRPTDFDTAIDCAMSASTVSHYGHCVYRLKNGRWRWGRWGDGPHKVQTIIWGGES